MARTPSTEMATGGAVRFLSVMTSMAIGFARTCPHELRHSGASLMLAQGTPLQVVSEVLGHASITITKDVYGHLLENDKRAAAESMTRALFGG